MTVLLVLVMAAAAGLIAALWAATTPGGIRVRVIAQRYSVWSMALPAIVGAWLLALLLTVCTGSLRAAVVVFVGLAIGAVLAGVYWVPAPGAFARARWRIAVRLRWASVCRAAELSRVEQRPQFGGLASARLTERAYMEWLPILSSGRSLPHGIGVTYRLRSARGGRIEDIAELSDNIAQSLGVESATVEGLGHGRGTLTILWHDPLGESVDAGDVIDFPMREAS